jgi:hypothetical protein
MTDPDGKQQNEDPTRQTGMGMGIWVAIGLAIGAALGNIGLGLVIGVVIGGVMLVINRQRDGKDG